MAKIGIFYGSSTGVTAEVAREIAKALNVTDADVHDVAKSKPSDLGNYDILVLGSSTWGDGDIEHEWYDFLDGARALDLKGKKIAIFGCGDETMADTFCNAVGILYKEMKKTGAEMIAPFDAVGYNFNHSEAALGNHTYAGLMLDQVNHPQLTPGRIAEWVKEIK